MLFDVMFTIISLLFFPYIHLPLRSISNQTVERETEIEEIENVPQNTRRLHFCFERQQKWCVKATAHSIQFNRLAPWTFQSHYCASYNLPCVKLCRNCNRYSICEFESSNSFHVKPISSIILCESHWNWASWFHFTKSQYSNHLKLADDNDDDSNMMMSWISIFIHLWSFHIWIVRIIQLTNLEEKN